VPAEQQTRRTRVLFWLSLIVPLSLYIGFASRFIGAHVGYQYDEALFVESAVFVLRGTPDLATWIAGHGRRWPLMIIPYMGTTKACVALPLFATLGISADVARFSGVVLGSLGIAGLVTLIGTQICPAAGLILGVFLAIHPSYLDYTVFDNGGVSVWMAAMGLFALALTDYLRRRSALSALLLGIAAGLGVWGRVNVLWLLASGIVAALVVFGRRAIPASHHIAAMMIGGLLGALPLISYELGSRLGTLRFISSTERPLSGPLVAQRLGALTELMISDGEQRGIWAGPPLPAWEIGIGGGLIAMVLLCACARIRSGSSSISRWRRAFAASAAVLTIIMLTSRLGIRQHHLAAVLPLALSALAILSVEIVKRLRLAFLPLGALAVGLAVLSLSWDARIDRGLRETRGKRVFSSAVYDLAEYLQSQHVPPDRLKILNWGLRNNLYVISRGSVYGSELFWGATKARSSRGIRWESEIRDGGSFLLYLFPTGPPALDAAAEGFSEVLKDYDGLRQERLFADRSGDPFARLVEILPTR